LPTCGFIFCANLVFFRAHAALGGSAERNSKTGDQVMGKGNNSQKNDKKNKKPKQDAKKPDTKSGGKK
jgi:hypothetical protein